MSRKIDFQKIGFSGKDYQPGLSKVDYPMKRRLSFSPLLQDVCGLRPSHLQVTTVKSINQKVITLLHQVNTAFLFSLLRFLITVMYIPISVTVTIAIFAKAT